METDEPHRPSHLRPNSLPAVIGPLTLQECLGKGRFSMVWRASMAEHESAPVGKCGPLDAVAVKIYRRAEETSFEGEVWAICALAKHAEVNGPADNIITLLGTYIYFAVDNGAAPRIHPCLIFELAGDTVSRLVSHCSSQGGMSLAMTKKITRDLLLGLAYMHAAGVVHCDVKPSNLLLNGRVDAITEDNVKAKVADFGSACVVTRGVRPVGTYPYRSPEEIIEAPCGPPIDVWAACASCFRMWTGKYPFDAYNDTKTSYCEPHDVSPNDVADDAQEPNGDAAGLSQGAQEGLDMSECSVQEYTTESVPECAPDDRYMYLVAKVLGPPPTRFALSADGFFDRAGMIKGAPEMTYISVKDLISANRPMDDKDAQDMADFLSEGFTYEPSTRITAANAAEHRWLKS